MGNTEGEQMLPEDFCLDWNDEEIKSTVSNFVFINNSTLPTQTKKAAEVGKIIAKDMKDKLGINSCWRFFKKALAHQQTDRNLPHCLPSFFA